MRIFITIYIPFRRQLLSASIGSSEPLENIPFHHYDYSKIQGACCENVIGYMPVPKGVASPLKLDGETYHVPMATTEGCLVPSTNRGCRALLGTGIKSRVIADAMSRGLVLRFPSGIDASDAMRWLEEP
jgi:hydroxymethylglutaryl-CoA reductase (NADPH)